MKKTVKSEIEKGEFYINYNKLPPDKKETLRLIIQSNMPISRSSYFRKFSAKSWNNSEIEFIEKRINYLNILK